MFSTGDFIIYIWAVFLSMFYTGDLYIYIYIIYMHHCASHLVNCLSCLQSHIKVGIFHIPTNGDFAVRKLLVYH